MTDVLVARMASGLHIWSSFWNVSCFRPMSSATHSSTKSASAAASARSWVVLTRAMVGVDVLELAQAAFRQEGEVGPHGLEALLQGLEPAAVHAHRIAGRGEDHGAAMAHAAATDDGDLLDVLQLHHPATAPPSTDRMTPVT